MNKIKRIVLNVLIVGYLVVIYFSGAPESNTLNTRLKKSSQTVAFALGIWPSWSMFAPNPIKFDSKTYVEVSFKNGEIKEFDVEPELTGVLATFRKARWMKYSQDNLRSPAQRGLLPPALRHFYAKYSTDENPVTKIRFTRKWKEVEFFRENGPLHPISSTPRYEKTEELIAQQY